MARCNAISEKEVQDVIVALLVVEKPSSNISVSTLDHNYKLEEGTRIPYRELGYVTLEDFLRTIPSIKLTQSCGQFYINFLGTEKTRHVSELVAKQKAPTKSQRSRSATCRRTIPPGYYPTRGRSVMPLSRVTPTYPALITEVLNIINKEPKGLLKNAIVSKMRERKPSIYFDISVLNGILQSLGSKVMIRENMVYPARNAGSSQRAEIPRNRETDNHRKSEFPWNSAEFREESAKLQKSITVSNLSVQKDATDIDAYDEGDFEYYSAVDSAQPKKTTLDFIQQSVPASEQKANTSLAQSEEVKNSPHAYNASDSVPNDAIDLIINERLKFRLEKLIQNQPKGIWCAELPKLYKEEYKMNLEWEELGFNSVSDLVAYLPDIFYCVQPHPAGDFQLFYAKNKDNITPSKCMRPTLASVYKVYNDPEDDVAAVPAALSSDTINNLIPEDVVPMGESIGQVPITCFNQDEKGYEEVVVCDAFTPSFFWIHLRRKQLKLEAMMNKLQHFYEQHKSKYTVPLIVLEKGLNVASLFYGKWHRAIVKAVSPDEQSTTTILFHDYGTLHKVPAREICFLHRSFSILPAQAIPCGLYNIRPPEQRIEITEDTRDKMRIQSGKNKIEWSLATSRRFVERVHDKPLVAICGKMDHENNALLISLTDTSKEEDVNIGDWLVEEGLAVHGKMDETMDPNDLSLYVENIDLEMGGENDETILKPPPGFSPMHIDFNLQIMQELRKDNEKLKSSHTRLFHRNVQLMSMIKAVRKITIMAPNIASIVDEEVLNSMELNINEDREHIFDYPAPLYDCFDCKVLRTVANDFQSQPQSVEYPRENGNISSSQIPTPTPKETRSVLSDSSEDLDFLITSSLSAATENGRETQFEIPVTAYNASAGVQQSRDKSQFEDEYQSFPSNSSIKQMDECESVSYDNHEFSDTNPFKQDLFSSVASLVHDALQKIPPPLPPRPKRFPSVPQVIHQTPQDVDHSIPAVQPAKNVEVNNNTTDSRERYEVRELYQENLPENVNEFYIWPDPSNSNIMNIVEDSIPYNCNFRVSAPHTEHREQFHINTIMSVNEKASDLHRYLEHNPQTFPQQPMKEATNSGSSINSVLVYSESQMPQEGNLVKNTGQCLDCVKIELFSCTMFVFFLDQEGWITIDQFRLALTNFTDNLPIKQFLIEHKNETKSYRILRKNENPKMFDLIDIKTREAGHCSTVKANSFYLIPVGGLLLKMLKALNIVPLEDIKNLKKNGGVTDNPVLRDCSKLLITCIGLKKYIHH